MIYCSDAVKWADEYEGPLHHAMLLRFAKFWKLSPFSVHVATMTESNEVGQVMGCNRICEVSKPDDMVNVQFLSISRFSHAAILTGVVVTISALSALFGPCRAIVAIVAAAQCWIACSAKSDCSTFYRAKTALMLNTDLFSRALYNDLADLADPSNPFDSFGARNIPIAITLTSFLVRSNDFALDNSCCSSFVKTLGRAYRRILCVLDTRWDNSKQLFTNGAFDFYRFCLKFTTQKIGTCTGACCLPTPFQPLRISGIVFFTDRAFPCNHSNSIPYHLGLMSNQ